MKIEGATGAEETMMTGEKRDGAGLPLHPSHHHHEMRAESAKGTLSVIKSEVMHAVEADHHLPEGEISHFN